MKSTETPALNSELEAMQPSLGVTDADNESVIGNFYSGKSIFITGATGFMGKVLVEKLLRSCSGVKNIYILLRSKKGVEPKNRLADLTNSRVFDRIREIDPTLFQKIVVIPGDITLPRMGISDEDFVTLVREVQIVFHSAATVKFDEPIKTSVNYNTLATRYIIEICRQLPKLQSFVHVSTCYSNCDRKDINEEFYPPPAPPQKIIEMTEWMDDDTLNRLTSGLLAQRPNTYTYTKALAEGILAQEAHGLPLAVVRPSIVTAAWREPFPGWIDNINGPTGLVLASGKGMLRTMLYEPNALADLIPVDIVINLMISVAWYTATFRPDKVRIYNCASGLTNGIRWADIEQYVFPLLFKYPSEQVFRYPGGTFKESRFLNTLCTYFDHILPAYAFDYAAKLFGKKAIMVRLYEKMHRAIRSLEWFTTHSWNFKSDNVIEMNSQLKGVDKKIFDHDVRNLVWTSYWEDYILGIRKFILKEDDSTLPLARQKLNRVYYTQKVILFVLLFLLWHILMRISFVNTFANNVASGVVSVTGKYVSNVLLPASQNSENVMFASSASSSDSVMRNHTPSTVSGVTDALWNALSTLTGFSALNSSN